MRRLSMVVGFFLATVFVTIGRAGHDAGRVNKIGWLFSRRNWKLLGLRGNTETFIDMVEGSGYIAEAHNVTTEDGYVLSVHRIPGGPKSPVALGKPVVILIHGLFGASDLWVLRGPGKDLAYILADEGYDVWAVNVRGNYYSRCHNNLSPKEPKFWNFSWHESGVYDMAAVIDYILLLTRLEKVSLIGYSMGSTMKFVLLSIRPEYNDKVHVAISLAPVAIITHLLPGLLSAIGINYGKEIEQIFKLLDMYEIFPRSPVDLTLITSLCERPKIDRLCQRLMFYFFGHMNYDQFDVNLIPLLLNHYPQGTSITTLQHYRQIIISGKFKQYDFGPEINYIRYKNETPPEYPLDKITVPVILFYGQNDPFTTEKDVRAIQARLPNVSTREVSHPNFSHLDFAFSKDSKRLVFDDIVKILNKYDARTVRTELDNDYDVRKLVSIK